MKAEDDDFLTAATAVTAGQQRQQRYKNESKSPTSTISTVSSGRTSAHDDPTNFLSSAPKPEIPMFCEASVGIGVNSQYYSFRRSEL